MARMDQTGRPRWPLPLRGRRGTNGYMRIRDALGVSLTLVLVSFTGHSAAKVAPSQTRQVADRPVAQAAARGPHQSAARPLARAALRTPKRAAVSQSSAGTLMLDWGDPDATPDAWKGNYVVIQPWEYDLIPGLKAKNPDLRVLMYKDVSATVEGACRNTACTRDNRILPTGVGYHWTKRHHPGWFLRDATGHQIEWSDWPGLFAMNVAKAGYQKRWSANVRRELRAHDWDGVMLDDVLTELSHTVFDDRVSTRIPDDAAMYAATEKFLAKVGPQLTTAGYEAVTNIAFQWDDWRSVVRDWSPYVSGWENEYFVKWGLGKESRFTGEDWAWKMRLAAWCARHSMPLLAVTYSTADDLVAQDYHRATWLLTWNGRTGSSIFVPAEDFTDHWLARPTVDIGRPTGPRQRLAGGIYRREYTRGVVLVNPTGASRRVRLGGSYRTPGGRAVKRVRLDPATASILRG